jgi:hypothetical protein
MERFSAEHYILICVCYRFSSQLGKYTFILGATGAILATNFQLSGMSPSRVYVGFYQYQDDAINSVKHRWSVMRIEQVFLCNLQAFSWILYVLDIDSPN